MRLRMQYDLPLHDFDVTAPLIYMWEIHNAEDKVIGRYIGKANGGEKRPTQHYSRNVDKLLRGLPYKKDKDYRRVHHALARAVTDGHRISLCYLCNVLADQNIFEVEMRYIREYGCDKRDGISLNGRAKAADNSLEILASVPSLEVTLVPAPSKIATSGKAEDPELLDLEDFLEFIEERYPQLFQITQLTSGYSFRIGNLRILRAFQSGPRGKVSVKLAQKSLREKILCEFAWDDNDLEKIRAIHHEVQLYRQN